MSAHCSVSGHDRAIYDAGCSSGVTIGTRACTATMTLPRVSASSRLESWASRSCNPRQNSMRAATDGGVSIEPKLATCSWQILPFNQAHCQPIGRLAKVHEHCSGTIRARFLPNEGGASLGCSRQLLANDVSFDHLVGAGEHGCRDFDAERLGRLQVDYQLELRRLFYRELAGFSPLQYLIDVNSRTVTDCVRIGSI